MFELTVIICLFYICWRLGGTNRDDHGTRKHHDDKKASDPWRRY